MHSLGKLVVAGGLVLITGPLSFSALAQGGYVDLEAEAAAREAAGLPAPEDPYGARPAEAYPPATSFGVNRTQAAPAVTAAPQAGNAAQSTGGNLGNLFLQIQQLQQDVMRLNGQVEEQAHELRQLKEQSLERYMELDKRLASGVAGESGSEPSAGAPAGASAPATTAPPSRSGSDPRDVPAAQPGEQASYDAAYALVAGRQFERALSAFQAFLQEYPGSRYSANAHYWLGELYLVIDPPDLEASRQAFALLISEYPENPKAPDALYKLGKVQFMKGNREKAREYLDLVISQYGSSDAAVAKLARDFINENY